MDVSRSRASTLSQTGDQYAFTMTKSDTVWIGGGGGDEFGRACTAHEPYEITPLLRLLKGKVRESWPITKGVVNMLVGCRPVRRQALHF